MKQSLKYILSGLIAYLSFLIVTVPADRAYALVEDHIPAIKLYDIEGSFWSGRATSAQLGKHPVQSLHWDIQLLSMFMGRLEVLSSLELGESHVEGKVGRTFNGVWRASEVETRIPMAEIRGLLSAIPRSIDGVFVAKLDQVEIKDQRIQVAQGTLSLEQVVTLLPGSNVELGTVHLTLDSSDGAIKGVLKDAGGPLQAQGELQLSPDGRYKFTGTFSSRDPKQPAIAQALRLLGRPGAGGKYTLTRSGVMPPIAF